MSSKLAAPQMVMNSRMLYTSWIPADPRAAAALLPEALEPAANGAIYMNQYVVDRAEQTTGFGAYSRRTASPRGASSRTTSTRRPSSASTPPSAASRPRRGAPRWSWTAGW